MLVRIQYRFKECKAEEEVVVASSVAEALINRLEYFKEEDILKLVLYSGKEL